MNKQNIIWRKDVIGWSLYDFANTIYSMNILTLYFKRWVVEDLGRDGLFYDIPYSLSMLLTALLMPALGALSDHAHKKRFFLLLFTLSCCLSLGLIPVFGATLFFMIIVLFALSNFFYEGGMVFYNSLLYSVSAGPQARFVSGFGVALGYLGAIAGMVLVLPSVTGHLFDISVPGFTGGGKVAAFFPTAILFFVFSLPLFLWVREGRLPYRPAKINFRRAYGEVWEGIRNTRQYPGVLRFLIADYFFEDAVATVILNMGIFSTIVLGFTDADLTIFFIISTVSAMAGAYLIGRLARNHNLKRMLFTIVSGWIIALIIFIFIRDRLAVYIMGSAVGILLGGLWTVSRPMLAEMVPRDQLGRFFGLYSLSGRAAAILGPVIWGLIIYLFRPSGKMGTALAESFNLSAETARDLPYQLAVAALALMMIIGLFIFRKIPDKKPERS